MYNIYCLVTLLYYEAIGKILDCEECPLKDKCNEYQIAKKFKR